MEFKSLEEAYRMQAIELAMQNYERESCYVRSLESMGCSKEIAETLEKLFKKNQGVLLVDQGKLIGYLAFWSPKSMGDEKCKRISSPICGYGVNHPDRGKIISLLFQEAAKRLWKENVRQYEIKVYAHDTEVISSYVLNQFGILCTDTIRQIEWPIKVCQGSPVKYVELDKQTINKQEKEILDLYHKLIKHLRQSPTFYPGLEFTDEVYLNYIRSVSTRVFVAKDKERLVGMMDASENGNSFITRKSDIMNVGDIYLEPSYRGKGIAQGLLQFASQILKEDGLKQLWVEHGTTNPAARGFWERYFEHFTYTLTREIPKSIPYEE